MTDVSTIQKTSPSLAIKCLVSQPYGTYIIRHPTSNDEVISSIAINSPPTATPSKDRYAVLSVRVDETVHKSLVMNYRLSLKESNGEQNCAHLLEQYNSNRCRIENFTPLKKEYFISSADTRWDLDPKQFHGIHFNKSRYKGYHHKGVSEAIWRRPNQNDIRIFIKRFSKDSHHFHNELNLLRDLCFFPIITLYGQYSDHQSNYLVFAHGGRSLESICPIQGRTETSKLFRIVNIAFQISNAMIYLEKKNIVHRDLTASNVLVDTDGFIRIADFGHAIQKEEGKNNLIRPVTNTGEWKFQVRFLAPECITIPIQSQTTYNDAQQRIYASFSSKSDVWAFGILMIQLMLKNPSKPYPHIEDDLDVARRVANNRETHPMPKGCNLDVCYLLEQCWAYEPINRISFTEIRQKMKILGLTLR